MVANSVLPIGWIRAGQKESRYSSGLTDEFFHSGGQCAYIFCTNNASDGGFGTIMQSVKAAEFRGTDLTLEGWIKTEDVTGWAGLWLRIDGASNLKNKSLQFENMFKRKVIGTTDWTQYEVVLPVAPEAYVVNFGGMLCGAGKAYFDDFSLVPTWRDRKEDRCDNEDNFDSWVNEEPVNLDFGM